MDTRVWDISRVFHPFNYKKIYPFISKVNPDPSYLSDILLYGSKSLEDAENKAIMEATILDDFYLFRGYQKFALKNCN